MKTREVMCLDFSFPWVEGTVLFYYPNPYLLVTNRKMLIILSCSLFTFNQSFDLKFLVYYFDFTFLWILTIKSNRGKI